MARRTAAADHQDSFEAYSSPPHPHRQSLSSPSSLSSAGAHPPLAAAPSANPSLRVTRSTARNPIDSAPASTSAPYPPSLPPVSTTGSRKRKPTTKRQRSPETAEQFAQSSPPGAKKVRTAAAPPASSTSVGSTRRGSSRSTMSQPGPSSRPSDDMPRPPESSTHERRRWRQNPKPPRQPPAESSVPSTRTPSARRQKKRLGKHGSDILMKDAEDDHGEQDAVQEGRVSSPSEDNDNGNPSGSREDDDNDPFRNALFGSRSPLGLQSTLRALSGMMSGVSTRLRDLLNQLRMKDEPSVQLIALQELSDLLLVSNEDNLSGHFSPDPYVKELVALMQPNDMGEENPEMMLLACRCLANLMEALRGSVANVVYGGAVPVLCQKLLDIQFIDLAEQALSTLAKISVDFPASIVREGGLTACLTYLDFFPTSTQRTAVTTAANCCRNLPGDSFPVVRDVIPILLNVLSSSDQKVVEQACLCVSRIVESFKHRPEKLEELIEPPMLKAILRLLLPGTTNLIGPHIHTQFLRVLSIVARTSPRLSVELLKMDVVDTLYQILTGVSAPRDLDNTGVKIDNVVIMQALVHRPREQVYESLNVICELLPGAPGREIPTFDRHRGLSRSVHQRGEQVTQKTKEAAEKRKALLEDCKPELKRFVMVLLPTLTDAYSSTVNEGVRQRVLTAQLKMLHNVDAGVIEDALRAVPYPSFLAAILSQKDHPHLVSLALQCARLLFERLQDIYQYQFHREGVISEVVSLAEASLSTEKQLKPGKAQEDVAMPDPPGESRITNEDASKRGSSVAEDDEDHDEDEDEDDDDDDNDDEDDDEQDDDHDDDDDENENMTDSESSASVSARSYVQSIDALVSDSVTRSARAFLQAYESSSDGKEVRRKALNILNELSVLASDIDTWYATSGNGDGAFLFEKLASYFDGDALESITSAELLNSGIIPVFLDVFGEKNPRAREARISFLRAFMGTTISEKAKGMTSSTTPFSILIQKLHQLLSRTEHFEVVTVSQNSLENTRSNATHMLGKQVRLKLVAEDDSDIPRSYKNIMVSIHAIATFKSLDDFLRPRISLSERPRVSRNREAFLSHLSARMRDGPGGFPGGEPLLPPLPSSRLETSTQGDRESTDTISAPAAPRATGLSEPRDRRTGTRRSSRHQSSNIEEPEDERPLECADEKQLSEEEDEDVAGEDDEDEEELNAIVDDLEDELEDDHAPEPSAVNMEVAPTGKVTARKEDGTRVATPSQTLTSQSRGSTAAASPGVPPNGPSSLALAGRPFSSYAAAIASIPQDWHIEFSVDGETISNETTIYRAVHRSRELAGDTSARSVWSAVHTVKFKRVQGPPPPEPSSIASTLENTTPVENDGLPRSLAKDSPTALILQILRVLHNINADLDDLLAESKELVAINREPLAQFINTKLTAKLNRQLEEPLIVASNCLPSWSEDLAREFPFLFPFETRHLFLQSTAFGYSRSMLRWQNSQTSEDSRRDQLRDDRPFLGRLQRQKVRISRSRILESAMKVMELYGSSPSILEVEYFEEVGTGLGPTLEFYSTVSKEFSKKKLKIWRENESTYESDFAFGKHGLFPAPMSPEQVGSEFGKKQLQIFKVLGKFVARSMLDSRIIDINFNPTFFRVGLSSVPPSLGTVRTIDQDLANSLRLVKRFIHAKKAVEEDVALSPSQRASVISQIEVDGVCVEDLGLDFTLPGYPGIELVENGSNIAVTIENVNLYLDRVIDMTLGSGIAKQVEAFRSGFSQVFPYSAIRSFTPNELVMLFGRIEEDWSIETLMDSIKADHGFNLDSRSVRNLLQTMSELDVQQRRDFLQFVTGSPKLPIGGFKSLTPMFTVVCRPSEPPYTSDDYLPSVMTCVNYLKLPDYSTLEILRERLIVAIQEGQGAFHLS